MEQDVHKITAIAKTESETMLGQAAAITIRKEADLPAAADLLKQVKTAAKNIGLKKSAIVSPLNQSLKEVRDLFRPIEGQLTEAEKAIKTAMVKYHNQVEARAAKQAAKVEAKVDAGEMPLAQGMGKISSIKQAPTAAKGETGGAQFREVRKVRIVDPSQLPVAYFLRPRVLEALRMEVSNDVLKLNLPVPAGAEEYKEKGVAGF